MCVCINFQSKSFITQTKCVCSIESTDPFNLVESSDGSGPVINSLAGIPLVSADLLPNGQAGNESGQFFISVRDVQLSENRRMRSKEIHYLDNPEFGLLILITPIKIQ